MFQIFLAALVAAIATASPAAAAQYLPFDRATFDAAQAAGQPVLVDVAAWWCPVCFSQERTIRETTSAPEFARLTIFKINYDQEKPEWKRFGVTKQATLIAFKGGREIGRIAYQTNKMQIRDLLAAAVR